MPTTLPRVSVTFEKPIYEILEEMAKAEKRSLSSIISELVDYAIELSEDLALVKIAEERLQTFSRDDAFASEKLLRWNKNRRKGK